MGPPALKAPALCPCSGSAGGVGPYPYPHTTEPVRAQESPHGPSIILKMGNRGQERGRPFRSPGEASSQPGYADSLLDPAPVRGPIVGAGEGWSPDSGWARKGLNVNPRPPPSEPGRCPPTRNPSSPPNRGVLPAALLPWWTPCILRVHWGRNGETRIGTHPSFAPDAPCLVPPGSPPARPPWQEQAWPCSLTSLHTMGGGAGWVGDSTGQGRTHCQAWTDTLCCCASVSLALQ